MYSRTELLIGQEGITRLQEAHVLLVGVGGVGGAAAHMLLRAGIGALTLIDGDRVATSNLNRQMVAYVDTIGQPKTEALAHELLRINPSATLHQQYRYLEPQDIPPLLSATHYHYIIDAIDSLNTKVELLSEAYHMGLPIVSSMGAGAKLDPLAIRIADISQTHTCALAKAVRKGLRQKGIYKGIPTVFSTEEAQRSAIVSQSEEQGKRSTVGTISYLPNIFGAILASHVIQALITPHE